VPNWDQPGSLGDWITGAVALRRPYGDNLLAVYALFMLAAPLGLYAMLRGRTLAFLAVSGLLWTLSFRYWLRWSNSPQSGASCQLLFALGMAAGFHEEHLAARWSSLSARARRALPSPPPPRSPSPSSPPRCCACRSRPPRGRH
jgi:hypothetical protein